LLKLLKRPKAEVVVALFLLVICLTTYGIIQRIKNTRWAIGTIPEIFKLIEADKYLAAFQLAKKVEKYIPNNSTLKELWPEMAREFSIITNPPGAEIYFRGYTDIKGKPLYLGTSPRKEKWFPSGVYRWEIRKAGFDTRECILSTFPNDSSKLEITLLEKGLYPEMLMIQSGTYGDFLIDKYEVTNQQFKEFVDQGGYRNRKYWKHKFVDEDGQLLDFDQAMDRFRDQTNMNGPATWEGGTYPEGQDDYPVGGVSWYEATAYAEFAGKIMPPLDLWNKVAAAEWALVVLDYSNFGGELTRVGHFGGISPYGAYVMAGNVREWVWNAPDDTQRTRYIRGGACNDADYMFTRWDIQSTWKRYAENGFRCVQLLTDGNEPPAELFSPKEVPSWIRTEYPTDFVKRPEDEIHTWVEGFAYDRSDLNAAVVSKEERRYWRKEKVIFNAAYDSDKIIANLFLPKNTEPPYQPILYFPGTGAQQRSSSDNLQDTGPIDFVVKSGRAVLYPVYKGTYERQYRQDPPNPYSQPAAYREWMQQLAADVGRSIDYLVERGDMDMEKLTYYGLSWGAYKGPIFMRVEQQRIKYGMLFGGGLLGPNIWRPQVDHFNYCGHVRAPVLMINGLQDSIFPIETSARAMYDLLGSEDKEFKTYNGGHDLFGLVSTEIKGDVLKWMDKHLGPIDFESQKP
jgi:pimeloyl-ACP methyl ester carboxylesterase